MKKIVVASGKGGVGKSMLASVLAMLFSREKSIVALDCDVDAPNLHLWLGEKEKWDKEEEIATNEQPLIDQSKCTNCGQCISICAFAALKKGKTKPVLNRFFCEGCAACEAVCPEKAIVMKRVKNARIRIKNNVAGFPLISAQLYPGQTGSGKIVEEIKKRAEQFARQIVLLDAPAGIGCPVIAALNGADFAVLITEPTISGLADLKRILTVVNHFQIDYGIVINKWQINQKKSREICRWAGKRLLGKISYCQAVFQAVSQLKPILATDLKVKKEIEQIYQRLLKRI